MATTNLSIRTTPEMKGRIATLANKTGRNISWYVNLVLNDSIEDLEDIYLAEKTLEEIKSGKQKTLTSQEMWQDFE